MSGFAGSRLKSAEPQSSQNDFAKPPSGAQTWTCSSPATIRKAPGATRPFADAAAPVRRWQRVQWQYEAETSGSSIS